VESFSKTLKYEELYLREYETFIIDVVARLACSIEEVYNREKTSPVHWLPFTGRLQKNDKEK
jgi:hypothetical protein